MSEPVPPGAPLLRSAAAPAGGGLCGAAGSGASVLFPQHLEGKQTGLMKNTHGKCFIISSSSPTALWHGSVIRKGFSPLGGSLPPRGEAERGGRRPRLCHFLSDRFGGICSDFLPATAPRSRPSLPSSALAARPAMKLYDLLRVLGVWWWGGGWTLWTPSCRNLQKLRNGSEPLGGSWPPKRAGRGTPFPLSLNN